MQFLVINATNFQMLRRCIYVSVDNIVACYATEDAVQIVNSFYYNLIRRDYNHLLHYCTFTQLTISTL
jgi:hypothetical protein